MPTNDSKQKLLSLFFIFRDKLRQTIVNEGWKTANTLPYSILVFDFEPLGEKIIVNFRLNSDALVALFRRS